MKLEVGMYVRTKHGIKKIESIVCGQDIKFDNTIGFDEDLRKHHDYDGISKNDNYFWNNEIVGKTSNNIIDLIGKGDILLLLDLQYNKKYKAEVILDSEGFKAVENYELCGLLNLEYELISKKHIKLLQILTKEQFESMAYEVE